MNSIPVAAREADGWDRLLAACLFGVAGGLIWATFAAATGLFSLDDDFTWQIGSAALLASTSVGALGAPGLVRRAQGESLVQAAGLGLWLMWGSYALGAVLFSLIASVADPSMVEMIPVVVLVAFAAATVLLSPGLLVGMVTAAIYGAIVRGESWSTSV